MIRRNRQEREHRARFRAARSVLFPVFVQYSELSYSAQS